MTNGMDWVESGLKSLGAGIERGLTNLGKSIERSAITESKTALRVAEMKYGKSLEEE